MAEVPGGRVVLIGGGPGADDLITVRGLDRLLAADVVIADRLAPTGLLTRLASHVEIIDAGRRPADDPIVTLMIDRARAGQTVVRLKGGDPFVFAHGAQEVRSCAEAGVPVEVVPGVTSATAAAALAVTDTGGRRRGRRILVLGGSASGKSGYAERLLAAESAVTYVATARGNPGDLEWTARIEAHRRRRPASWTTIETTDLPKVLGQDDGDALLIDSITSFLAQIMDDCGCCADPPLADAGQRLDDAIGAMVGAWSVTSFTAIAVSDEVGSGVVPPFRSGRAFRDALGRLNQRLAAAADEIWLVTAGIPRRLR